MCWMMMVTCKYIQGDSDDDEESHDDDDDDDEYDDDDDDDDDAWMTYIMFLLVAEDTIAQVTFFRLPESGQSAENVVIYYLLTIIGCFTICLLSPQC